MPLLCGSLSSLTQNQKQALNIIEPQIGLSEAIITYNLLPAKQVTEKQSHSVMNKNMYAALLNHSTTDQSVIFWKIWLPSLSKKVDINWLKV